MRLILPIALALSLSVPAFAQDKAQAPAKVEAPKTEAESQKPEAPKTAAPAPEASKPEVTKNGDWFVGCQQVSVDGASVKACEMQQILEDTKTGQAFIRISVIYPHKSKKPVLRILTPLGVLLQKGLVMQIDDGKEIVLPFAICVSKPPACVIDGLMEEDIIKIMKRGNGGTLTLSLGNNQVVKAPFSLNGFTKSITSIEPK